MQTPPYPDLSLFEKLVYDTASAGEGKGEG
jgi:hypothetical protein